MLANTYRLCVKVTSCNISKCPSKECDAHVP